MSDEKKIEDLIHSISSLINEAKQENELLLQIENKIDDLGSEKNKILVNENLEITSDKTKSDDSKQLNTSKYHDWKTLSFLKKEFKKDSEINLEENISKIFESEIDIWMKLNLKNIIQSELNKFSDKIIAEKLK